MGRTRVKTPSPQIAIVRSAVIAAPMSVRAIAEAAGVGQRWLEQFISPSNPILDCSFTRIERVARVLGLLVIFKPIKGATVSDAAVSVIARRSVNGKP